jgi:hypothetical protein
MVKVLTVCCVAFFFVRLPFGLSPSLILPFCISILHSHLWFLYVSNDNDSNIGGKGKWNLNDFIGDSSKGSNLSSEQNVV